MLRTQPRREMSKKDILNGKYEALADDRRKLIAIQLQIAQKEALRTRVAHEQEMQVLKKQKLLSEIKHGEEERKIRIELLKQQINNK